MDKIASKYAPPKTSKSDAVHWVARVGLSAAPIIGGPAVELFSRIFQEPLSKRREEWFSKIASGLEQLETTAKDFKIENLKDNESFLSIVLYASQLAFHNHQKEKLVALQNIVLNAAAGIKIEEDQEFMFLNLVDQLTPTHLKVLVFFENPRKYGEQKGIKYPDWYTGSPGTVLEHTFPELASNKAMCKQMLHELDNLGLTSVAHSFGTQMTVDGMFSPRITDYGRLFLVFISSPAPAKL